MDNITRKVSNLEVEALHAFTRRHFVEYYDLQTELTDHLANAIELQWATRTDLSFDEALTIEFKKFGIFGFMDVVEKRQLALTKRYHKLCWKYVREFFKLPKIIISALAVILIYKVARSYDFVFATVLGALMLVSFGRLIYMNYNYRRKIKKTGQRWMFEEVIFRAGGVGMAFLFPFQFNSRIISGHVQSLWFIAILAAWTVVFALCQYVILFYIPARAKEHLVVLYPEYKLELSE